MEDDQPRANVDYTLVIDGQIFSGTTDGSGKIEQSISPNAKKGILILENDTPINLQLGHIDPIETITGVQQRLINLGFDCGGVHGNLDSETKKALKDFQETCGLTASGELDKGTEEKLLEKHGS
jgi:N-acetylmuramoyl-L-alanine amidase